jgi:hypothetical protein
MLKELIKSMRLFKTKSEIIDSPRYILENPQSNNNILQPDGNVAIIGTIASGKTYLIKRFIYKSSQKILVIHSHQEEYKDFNETNVEVVNIDRNPLSTDLLTIDSNLFSTYNTVIIDCFIEPMLISTWIERNPETQFIITFQLIHKFLEIENKFKLVLIGLLYPQQLNNLIGNTYGVDFKFHKQHYCFYEAEIKDVIQLRDRKATQA